MAGARRDPSGFTIVEILIAIVIVVAVMAIMSPPTASAIKKTTLRGLVGDVIATHDLARTLAVQHGRPTQMAITSGDTGGERLLVSLEVIADTTVGGTGVETVRRVKLGNGRLVSNRRLVCFDGRGLPSTQGACEEPDAIIVVILGAEADTIRFSPMGQVRP